MDALPPNKQPPEFFARYLNEAARWLSVVDVKHRGAAIELSKYPPTTLDGVQMVKELCAALDGPWWKETAKPLGKNWIWREQVPAHVTESKEVELERRLAQRSLDRWTCQMSTSSGLRPGVRDSRRSIDIVQHVRANEYRFIELKVGSDHPLYATFEVLGYGLLYLLARHHGQHGNGRHDVMDAHRIELVVLGPDNWFKFKDTRKGSVSRFNFDWLEKRINDGLLAEVRSRGCDGLDEVIVRSAAFNDTASVEASVGAIEALLS